MPPLGVLPLPTKCETPHWTTQRHGDVRFGSRPGKDRGLRSNKPRFRHSPGSVQSTPLPPDLGHGP